MLDGSDAGYDIGARRGGDAGCECLYHNRCNDMYRYYQSQDATHGISIIIIIIIGATTGSTRHHL
jgi:hypothetical protein